MPPETHFDADSKPRLRRHLEASENGQMIVIHDSRRIGHDLGVSRMGFEVAVRLDGTRTLAAIQAELLALTGGNLVPLDSLQKLVEGFDEALLLDSSRLRSFLETPIRKPSHIPLNADKTRLVNQLNTLFTANGGAGLPGSQSGKGTPAERLRAVLLPHMDYGRGNITYGFGFKELLEKTDARVFVIIATAHYSAQRFILNRQHFDTPFGLVETDQDYVNRIVQGHGEQGESLFDDLEAHIPEHSIELEVVPLKHLMGDRPFRIVPLLVGSFRDRIQERKTPADAADIARMVRALREAEAACPEEVCYLISGDLAHIGPKFRDNRRAAGPWLEESRAKDQEILATFADANPNSYFQVIAEEGDGRRICGLSPTWLTLEVAKPKTGKVLHYQQFIDPSGHESVSFAAASFYE